ncbi:MAG: DegT/DnrJ/EryC1/StrS family aminotransferase [Pedobacter sp.]
MNDSENSIQIPYSRVICDGQELELIREVLESGWLTTAGKCALFEEKFAAIVNAEFACAVNSCTAALHLALESLGIGPGDKIFVPTMTFTATAEVVRYLGADPIFLDVEYGTSLITAAILKKAIADYPGARALIVVHFGGQVADMIGEHGPGLIDICRENGIRVIEDAAHAFPAQQKEKMVGSIGDITCFSFYANKPITTGEGGMVTTNDPGLADRMRLMRLHGIDRDIWNRYTSENPSWEYDVLAPGFKYNMPDINAAIGLAQLERAYLLRQNRERCARFYFDKLQSLESVDLPVIMGNYESHAWHLFPIILKDESLVHRKDFIEQMATRGIGTSVHYKPLHRMSYYQNRYSLDPDDFPNAEKIWRGCVSLPIYPSLNEKELEFICSSIKDILK